MIKNTIDMGKFVDLAAPKPEISVSEVNVLSYPRHLELLAHEICESYNLMIDHRGGKITFDKDMMYRFFITSIVERVKYVNNDKGNRYKSLIQYNEHPHILGILVANIGKCYDDQTNIELIPAVTNVDVQLLTDEEYLDISRKLRSLRTLGISVGSEFPSDKKGDFLTMSFTLVDDAVKREDTRAHPTQALLALIAGLTLVNSIITPRVTYITKDRMDTLIRAAAQFEFSK